MTSALDVAVTRRYGRAHAALRDRFGHISAGAWDRLGSYDEADIATLAHSLRSETAAARQQAATLTAGYLNHFTGSRRIAPILGALTSEVWRPPFMTTWAALARGESWDLAVRAGRDRMLSTGSQIITSSSREAAAGIDADEPRIIGWNRVPSGSCCAWCAEMADVDWDSAEGAALGDQHDNCNCDLVPITADAAPGRELNADLSDAPSDAAYVSPDGDAADRPA